MARELGTSRILRQNASHAGRQGGRRDQTGDLSVVQPVRTDALSLAGNPPKQRAMNDPGQFEPCLKCNDWDR